MELRADNLTFRTFEKTVLRGAAFSCPLGSRTALLGPAGSGKKALLLLLGGYLRPTSGRVTLGGEDIFRLAARYRARVGLGAIAGLNPLGEEMTARENVSLRLELSGRPSSRADVQNFLDRFALGTYADTKAKELPPRLAARASLACACAADPDIVLLDEPTAPLLSSEREDFWALAESALGDRTLIFSTKELSEAEKHADRTIRLEGGLVIQEKL